MRNKQRVTIAALVVAIIGLSIGFAAFSNVLNINSTASVNPDASSLKVVFAKNHFSQQVTTISQLDTSAVAPYSASTGASGGNATINNEALNGPTLTGLKASFTAPNQSVVYKLNVVNAGKLKAYLTDIVFGTTGNPAKAVSCTVATKDSNNQDIPAVEQATDTLVQSACNGISISVKIGELDAKTASGSLNNLELDVAGYKEVIITISYASGSAYVDGPMNVVFGDIEINAKSVGGQSQGGGVDPNAPTFEITSSDITTNGESNGNMILLPLDSEYTSEEITQMKNNMHINNNSTSISTYYFNDVTSSDSSLEDISDEDIMALMNDDTQDDFYYVNYYEAGGGDYLIIMARKDGDYLSSSTDDTTFEDFSITITGSDTKQDDGVEWFESGLLVDDRGRIITYEGNATSVSIPATAPAYVETSTKTFYMRRCIASLALGSSTTREEAVTTCSNYKTQWENGELSSEAENYLKDSSVKAIANAYRLTGDVVNITQIRSSAFDNANLTSVDFSGATNLTEIGTAAFQSNNITTVIIPSSVTSIGGYAFNINPLINITIGDSINGSNITNIGDQAFDSNTNGTTIESVTIYRSSDGVTIGSHAFGGSKNGFDITNSWHPVS